MSDFVIEIVESPAFVLEFATVGPQGAPGDGSSGSGVSLGSTSTTAHRGDHGVIAYNAAIKIDAKILYVDSSGNDSTAVVGRRDLPYLTPLAAQTAASSGDTIIVRPGSYSGAALGGKAGISWYWEAGSQYTNTTNNANAWAFAAGVHNVLGHGKFYQTSGNSGYAFFADSGRTGTFEADYIESVGGSLLFRDSCNVRVKHAKSSGYDVILASPAVVTAVQDIEVGVVDAASNPIALEGTATSTIPISIRVGNIIAAGDYLVIEESSAAQNATIFIGDSVKNGVEAPESAIYSDVSSEVSIVFANWRYATLPANDGASTTYKIFVLNQHVHAGEDITTGTVDPARLGSGSSIATKFLRGDSTWQTIATSGVVLTTTDQTIAGNKTFNGIIRANKTIENAGSTYLFDEDTIGTIDLTAGQVQQIDLAESISSGIEITFTRPSGSNSATGKLVIVFHPTLVRDIVVWQTTGGTVRWLGVEPDWATYTNRRVTIDWTVIATDVYLEVAKYVGDSNVDIPIQTITYGATMAIDAAAGNKKHITLAGNGTISNPTNPVDGRVLTFRLRQDGTGSRVPVWGAKYRFRGDLATVTLSTTAGRTDHVAFQYDVTDDVWACISFIKDS